MKIVEVADQDPSTGKSDDRRQFLVEKEVIREGDVLVMLIVFENDFFLFLFWLGWSLSSLPSSPPLDEASGKFIVAVVIEILVLSSFL